MSLAARQAHAQAPSGTAPAALTTPVTGNSQPATLVSPILTDDTAMPVAAAPAPVPLTQPGRVGTETLNGAVTAWMMTSTALVL